jgi:hypothetical protein
MEGRTEARQISEPTKIKPFNLTAPKARIVPIPKIVRIHLILHVYLLYELNLDTKNR